MFRTCSEHFRDVFGTCLGICLAYYLGTCWGHVRDMLGTCWRHVWDMFGTYLGYVEDTARTCWEHVRDMFRLYVGFLKINSNKGIILIEYQVGPSSKHFYNQTNPNNMHYNF